MKENFIDINDWSTEELLEIFEFTDELKPNYGKYRGALNNQTLLMLFAKPSTRTRVSFEAGTTRLGGHAIYFNMGTSQLDRGEALSDTAEVLSRYCDAIMGRLFEHEGIVELAEFSDIPVINGLTDLLHPCQAMADFYTLREHGKEGPLAYVGDGNNVAHSLMQLGDKLGREVRVATPPGYEPDDEIINRVSDDNVWITNDPEEAVRGADAIYTDVFVSMGDVETQEEYDAKLEEFKAFQVNSELMAKANKDAVFLHCLPAKRGEEVTSEVLDSPQSVVFDEAENRMHVQNALMLSLIYG